MRTILLYTDPGTGAMIWQLLIAAGLGATFYFRHYIAKVRTLLSARKNRGQEIN
jgi:hypothetical protein